MACGVREGCILSPLLFLLYSNSLVTKLKKAEVGVMCRKQLISVLLYRDGAVTFAEDEKLMRRSWIFWLYLHLLPLLGVAG